MARVLILFASLQFCRPYGRSLVLRTFALARNQNLGGKFDVEVLLMFNRLVCTGYSGPDRRS